MRSITQDKQALRYKIQNERKLFNEYQYQQANANIYNHVDKLLQVLLHKIARPAYIGLYWALKAEPDLLKLAITYKYICLPKVVDNYMYFVKYCPGDAVISAPYKGLYQPKAEKVIEPQIIILPGLQFSITGHRLGFGKGYYDHYLYKINPSVTTIGTCFHQWLTQYLPIDSHDATMNYVVTENHIIKFS